MGLANSSRVKRVGSIGVALSEACASGLEAHQSTWCHARLGGEHALYDGCLRTNVCMCVVLQTCPRMMLHAWSTGKKSCQ